MQKFIDYIRKYVNLTEDEVHLLQHSVEVKELHPNEAFFRQGQIANEIYFVLEGWIRLFYNVEIEDKTAFFYKQGQQWPQQCGLLICLDDLDSLFQSYFLLLLKIYR